MKLSSLILEFIEIATICDSNLCVAIRETNHAKERSDERHISDDEIKSIVKEAIPKLNEVIHHFSKRKQIFSSHGKYFHIKKDDVNIIGALRFEHDKKKYLFNVVTVVRKNDFHEKPDTEKIEL
jgi:hypothetical protein